VNTDLGLPDIDKKTNQLREHIRAMPSAIVAFSAGVDSTFLTAVVAEELGERGLAVTATSPAFPERELQEAVELATRLGATHKIIRSNELADPNYANNPSNRCYHCKTELYTLLRDMADREGFAHILDGTNADDLGGHRPGHQAAKENRVESPLVDLEFSKAEIREASRRMGLKTHDKPAFACLASRFPYGLKISADALKRVEKAENILRDLGFVQVRVRVHDTMARIELAPDEIEKAFAVRETLVRDLKALGYHYVTLDLQGYRTGSLNEILPGLP